MLRLLHSKISYDFVYVYLSIFLMERFSNNYIKYFRLIIIPNFVLLVEKTNNAWKENQFYEYNFYQNIMLIAIYNTKMIKSVMVKKVVKFPNKLRVNSGFGKL